MQKDLSEWNNQVKDQPDVNHFYVGSAGELVGDIYEHGCEDEHDGEVDSQDVHEEGLGIVFTIFNNMVGIKTVNIVPKSRLPREISKNIAFLPSSVVE